MPLRIYFRMVSALTCSRGCGKMKDDETVSVAPGFFLGGSDGKQQFVGGDDEGDDDLHADLRFGKTDSPARPDRECGSGTSVRALTCNPLTIMATMNTSNQRGQLGRKS